MRSLAWCVLALVASGCIRYVPPGEGSDAAVDAPAWDTASYAFDVQAGTPLLVHADRSGVPFDVAPGAGALVVEAEWSCPTSACELQLVLRGPGDEEWRIAGAERARLDVAAPSPGRYEVELVPADVVVEARGTLHVTPFATAPPEGFTALAP